MFLSRDNLECDTIYCEEANHPRTIDSLHQQDILTSVKAYFDIAIHIALMIR